MSAYIERRFPGVAVPIVDIVDALLLNSPHLPRIPGDGGIASYSWVAFGKAVITPERRAKRASQGSPLVLGRP